MSVLSHDAPGRRDYDAGSFLPASPTALPSLLNHLTAFLQMSALMPAMPAGKGMGACRELRTAALVLADAPAALAVALAD
jgi:hypothetical protein